MIKEACVETISQIEQAIKNGANRIELCDNLSVGGTT
ncbi:copper homeostasis protein CutC, partial [Mammaliicoccus sciuri]